MSRKKKVKRLYKAQRAADLAVAKAWRRRAKLTGAALQGAVRGRSLVKGAQVDPFDAFLARKAATGDVTARQLLVKRGADGDFRYRQYLEKTLRSATSAEVRAGCAAELARLDGDAPAPVAKGLTVRWSPW